MTWEDEKLNRDFADFLSAPATPPPTELSEKILARVKRELNPPRTQVFLKVLGIHSVVSLFSLSICSQFGIQSFALYDAMNVFMKFMGHAYCMALCGFLYFAVSALALGFLLTPEEIKSIRKDFYAQFLVLSGVSLGVFVCLGAQVLMLPTVLWMAGTLVGGFGALELGWRVRSKFRQRLIYGI